MSLKIHGTSKKHARFIRLSTSPSGKKMFAQQGSTDISWPPSFLVLVRLPSPRKSMTSSRRSTSIQPTRCAGWWTLIPLAWMIPKLRWSKWLIWAVTQCAAELVRFPLRTSLCQQRTRTANSLAPRRPSLAVPQARPISATAQDFSALTRPSPWRMCALWPTWNLQDRVSRRKSK